jgi:hypothetical protein
MRDEARFQARFRSIGDRVRGDTSMRRNSMITILAIAWLGCNDDGSASSSPSDASTSGPAESSGGEGTSDGSASTTTGGESTSGDATTTTAPAESSDSGGPGDVPSCADLPAFIAAFKESHSGNGGTDWDINAMTPAEVANDPDAQTLLALCEGEQRPVIPALAWEYGGGDHQWISPESSAIYYCVYTPVNPSTDHWSFDEAAQLVEADVTIGCPEQNPCADQSGADQVLPCLGDPTNIEIVVDTASLDDGHGVGLELSEAATDLYLLEQDGTRVLLWHDA